MFIVFEDATRENFDEIKSKLLLYNIDLYKENDIRNLDYNEDSHIGMVISDYHGLKEGYILNCIKKENLRDHTEFIKLNYYICLI